MKVNLIVIFVVICMSTSASSIGNHDGRSALGATTNTELLDSVLSWGRDRGSLVWSNVIDRSIYTYDSRGNLLSDFEGQWGNIIYIDSFAYDANSNRVSISHHSWQGGGGWEIDSLAYDLHNNLTSQTYLLWDITNHFNIIGIKTYEYIYDSTGNIIGYNYRYSNSGTIYTNQEFITVDGSTHLPLSHLYQNWDSINHEWVNINRYFYSYGSAGTDTAIKQSINTYGSWVNSIRSINSNTVYLQQVWLPYGPSGSWENDFMRRNTFDTNGRITNNVSYNWINNSWQMDLNSQNAAIFTYDIHLNVLTDVFAHYQDSIWVIDAIDTLSYDSNNNEIYWQRNHPSRLSTSITEDIYWYSYDSCNFIVSSLHSELSDNNLILQDSIHYYYFAVNLPSSVDEVKGTLDISVNPVPTHDLLKVVFHSTDASILTATMYDMTGRKVMTQEIRDDQSVINVSSIPIGVYQMVFTDEKGNIAIKRVILE